MEFQVKLKSYQKQIQANSFEELRKNIKRDFKYIVSKQFCLSYTDDETDKVTIANKDDFEVMLGQFEGQIIEILVESSDELESQGSDDELKNSITGSIKLLRNLNNNITNKKLKKVDFDIIIEDNFESKKNDYAFEQEKEKILTSEKKQIHEIEQKIEKYRNLIKELEDQIHEIKKVPASQNDGFHKFFQNLEKSEEHLWLTQDQYQFKDKLIEYLALQDDFKVMIKQRAKEFSVQWKKQQAKQKYISKYQGKLAIYQDRLDLNQSIYENKQTENQVIQIQLNENKLHENIDQPPSIQQLFYKNITNDSNKIETNNVTEKAQLISNVLNIPISKSLLDYIGSHSEFGLDELVWMTFENLSFIRGVK